MMYSTGDHIWVEQGNGDFEIPKGCTVVRIQKKKIQVQDEDGKMEWTTTEKILKSMHASSITPLDNMIHLDDLQEYTILRNLHMRYKNQLIYTYIGDMLIAVNPYQVLNIYSTNEVSMYSERKTDPLPPHIFATSYKSFVAMKDTRQNQCILISGESGAGKTESTKLILQYLTTTSAGGHSWIKQQILEANPILEAFGNAKTPKNSNSSRFGKYINIYFNNNGEIEGARIDYYLLEKSRIVMQSKYERNYHIFYSLLTGLSIQEKQKLYLGNASDYKYLQGVYVCKDRDDPKTFAGIKAAMQVLNYNEKTFSNIIRLLSMILHLGNLKYKATTIAHVDGSEIHDDVTLKRLGELLGVSENTLTHALTKRTIFAKGEQVVSNLSKNQACEVRDAFAKIIYKKIFEKIVQDINNTLCSAKAHAKNTIGILDICGFENFDSNSFEQLCINYANERLQQFFVQHIFKIEQANYISEGIFWNNIDYVDNQEIIDSIGVKPLNIMSLIDEETVFPKGSDKSLLSKLSLVHGTNNNFKKPKSSLSNEFGIVHFAGVVQYDVSGFLDKNRDILSGDFKQLIAASSNNFLKDLFAKNELTIDGDCNRLRSTTLSTKFRDSLESLMSTLNNCNPFFIRCIKPNENQLPKVFDRTLCCRQLRYSGVAETVQIKRAGYPVCYNYTVFAQRFRTLARGLKLERSQDAKYTTENICAQILNAREHDYRFGHSKVFLKDYQSQILERKMSEALRMHALIIQKSLRMWIVRIRFIRMKNAAVIIQKTWRAYRPRKNYCALRQAVLRLQSRIRSRHHVVQFQKKRRIIILLQAACRRYLIQKWYQEKRKKIQMEKMEALSTKIGVSLKHKIKDSRQLNDESENIDTIFDFLDNDSKHINSRKVSDIVHTEILRKDLTVKSSFKITDEINNSEVISYDFYKFAAIYFTGNATPHFSKKPLKQSLLDLPHLSDQLAAKALSITIFRFMGDLPEPESPTENYSTKTVMSTITKSLSKHFRQTDNYNKFVNQNDQHFLRMTLKKKNKINNIITKGIINDEYESWLNSQRSNLEKLHFIIGHGILRTELKDEIYCQVVKQLIHNPSKTSHAKGWVLLSLCIGCFAPSEKFISYLKSFIKTGPPDYAPFCEKRLDRTYRNGSRSQPPCWIEMQSVKYKEPIPLKINFMDGALKRIIADSASTAREIVDALAESINLKDTFGFSLFIAIDDKVLSLGSERDHVMDAISQCEQYAKEQGHLEHDAPWRFLFRKEIFSPWHDPTLDRVATNLIYHQVCKGIKMGEYRCHNEHDMAMLIAQQLYVQYRSKSIPKNFRNILHSYIPNQLLQENVQRISSTLEQLTIEAYQKIITNTTVDADTIKIKESTVTYAKEAWSILFSRFYEANKIFGPNFDLNEVIISVNSIGVYFIDNQERILQQFSFPEISEVNYQKNDNMILHNLTILTIQRKEFVFQSADAESFVSLVNHIIDGLRQRSIYVVAIQVYVNTTDAESTLTLKKGDVIKLTGSCTGSVVMTSSWGSGKKNGKKGKFPCEYVYVLPTISKPSPQLTEIFKADFVSKSSNFVRQELNENLKDFKHYTLKNFASEHFRTKSINSGSGISTATASISKELWKHTREPIKAPLLAKLLGKNEQFQLAKQIFTNILRYMGDLPSNRQRIGTEYTDQIFGPALKDQVLRDEVYCQIMRQLTDNKVRLSEERGWELMWLATGIMPCSAIVLKELEQFLISRDNVVAQDCLKRLCRIVATRTIRIYPPYILEVEAIRFKNLQIYHKIYFPDATDAAFEVHSSTRALDICIEVARKLQLRKQDGFSLYFTIANRIVSVPQYYFFFDFIHEVIDWITRLRHAEIEASLETKYQVLFIKKIWIDCFPGRDKNADSKFHFFQEAFKYLRGYHKCSKKDAIELATMIYISGHVHNKEELYQIDKKLQEYVPADMINLMSPKKWKKRIITAYRHNKNLSQDQAKEVFLQCVHQWPTFGSAFFEVRQTSDTKFPKLIVLAINKNGVSAIDPNSKDILAMYSFTEITNWSSGDTYFHLTIGNFMNGRKLLCETDLGYKMDDLISSYIDYLQGNANVITRIRDPEM